MLHQIHYKFLNRYVTIPKNLINASSASGLDIFTIEDTSTWSGLISSELKIWSWNLISDTISLLFHLILHFLLRVFEIIFLDFYHDLFDFYLSFQNEYTSAPSTTSNISFWKMSIDVFKTKYLNSPKSTQKAVNCQLNSPEHFFGINSGKTQVLVTAIPLLLIRFTQTCI